MDTINNLKGTVVKYRKLARRNYYAVFFLYAVAVMSSVVATLLAISKSADGVVLGIFTALPASAILMAETFKFSEKARWHFEKKNQLNAILRLAETVPPALSEKEIVNSWNRVDAALEKTWPGFGGNFQRLK